MLHGFSRTGLFFQKLQKIVIADDYAEYDSLLKGLSIPCPISHVELMHSAIFFDCLEGYGAEANRVQELIRTLYAIDQEAKEEADGISDAMLFRGMPG